MCLPAVIPETPAQAMQVPVTRAPVEIPAQVIQAQEIPAPVTQAAGKHPLLWMMAPEKSDFLQKFLNHQKMC